MSLILSRPVPALGAHAFRGVYGGRDVVAYLGTEEASAAAERASSLVNRQEDGLLPLLGVVEHKGGCAWVYPSTSGVSGHTLITHPPPLRVVLDLAAQVLRKLMALARVGLHHPDPRPVHVLVDSDGQVSLVGFADASGRDPLRAPPGSPTDDDESALAYHFGLLACELLGGGMPETAPDADAQRTVQRRAAIHIMSRPGPVLSEEARNAIVGCLAYAPEERPPLASVLTDLEDGSLQLPAPGLVAWAREGIPNSRLLASESSRSTVEVSTEEFLERSEEGDFIEDDVTAVSAGSTPGRHRRHELGSIPVTVGPPAEVARRRPRLPADLFDDEPVTTTHVEPAQPAPRSRIPLVMVAVLLIGVALALAAYLF